MRRLRDWVLVLACAVFVLGVGSILPRLVFAGEGAGAYSGEKAAFARFALEYDSTLREWPFPMDPSVARTIMHPAPTTGGPTRVRTEARRRGLGHRRRERAPRPTRRL